MKERQRKRQPLRISAVDARASEHHIAMVLQNVCVDTVPEKFDGALVAVRRKHAGTAKLEELQTVMTRDESADVKLASGVESTILLGKRLAQQSISADHGRSVQRTTVMRSMINHEQVVAYRVVAIDIAPRENSGRARNRGPLLIKNLVANFLSLTYLSGRLSQPYFQCADPAHCPRSPVSARRRCA